MLRTLRDTRYRHTTRTLSYARHSLLLRNGVHYDVGGQGDDSPSTSSRQSLGLPIRAIASTKLT